MLSDKQKQFFQQIKEDKENNNIESSFIYYVSSVIQKVRPGALLTIQDKYYNAYSSMKEQLIEKTGLDIIEMINFNHDVIWLIVDRAHMQEHLQCQQIKDLLEDNAYTNTEDLQAIFETLTKRFKESNFPHEIGVFLGYPIQDVKGFIQNKGQDCLHCKFWKVYHDVEYAQAMFDAIEFSQLHAMNLLVKFKCPNITLQRLKTTTRSVKAPAA